MKPSNITLGSNGHIYVTGFGGMREFKFAHGMVAERYGPYWIEAHRGLSKDGERLTCANVESLAAIIGREHIVYIKRMRAEIAKYLRASRGE